MLETVYFACGMVAGPAIYFDATKNGIGLTNNTGLSAGAWASYSFFFPPFAFLYLIRRHDLLQTAATAPVHPRGRKTKLGIFIILGVLLYGPTLLDEAEGKAREIAKEIAFRIAGFDDLKTYEDFLKSDFQNGDDYRSAKTQGFTESSEYYRFLSSDFENGDDYREAMRLGATSAADLRATKKVLHALENPKWIPIDSLPQIFDGPINNSHTPDRYTCSFNPPKKSFDKALMFEFYDKKTNSFINGLFLIYPGSKSLDGLASSSNIRAWRNKLNSNHFLVFLEDQRLFQQYVVKDQKIYKQKEALDGYEYSSETRGITEFLTDKFTSQDFSRWSSLGDQGDGRRKCDRSTFDPFLDIPIDWGPNGKKRRTTLRRAMRWADN